MGFDHADPRGSPLFRLGLGRNGRLRSKTRRVGRVTPFGCSCSRCRS